MRNSLAVLILSLGLVLNLAADNVRITSYSTVDGLLNSDINCAIQDSIGYLWFATNDGLARYDGHRFKTFKARVGDNSPLMVNKSD